MAMAKREKEQINMRSGFTYLNLILTNNKEIIKEYLEQYTYLVNYSNKWVCLLTEFDSRFDGMSVDSFTEKTKELSEKIPILYFAKQDGEGFRFSILYHKQIISSLNAGFNYTDYLPTDEFFSDINLDNFSLFGISQKKIYDLSILLTPENFQNKESSVYEDFLKILDIGELIFTSWDSIIDNESIYSIVAKGEDEGV